MVINTIYIALGKIRSDNEESAEVRHPQKQVDAESIKVVKETNMENNRGFSNADPAKQLKELFDINSQQPRLNIFGGMYMTEGNANVLCYSLQISPLRALQVMNL